MPVLNVLMALYAICITPLRLKIDVAAGAHLSGAAVFWIWGFHLQGNLALSRNEQGVLQLSVKLKGSDRQHSGSVADTWQALRRLVLFLRTADKTRAFLLRSLHVLGLGIKVRLGFDNAAHTALMSGSVCALLSMLREWLHRKKVPCDLRAWPDFTGKPCAAQVSCILFMRLGNLLFGCAMAGLAMCAARIREKKSAGEEEHAWSTPSET